MKKKTKKKKPISAEQIARMATRGEDVSSFFTNHLRIVVPIQRVNVDFTGPMLAELDDVAKELNISRQAVIKTLLREGLDRRFPQTRVNATLGDRTKRRPHAVRVKSSLE